MTPRRRSESAPPSTASPPTAAAPTKPDDNPEFSGGVSGQIREDLWPTMLRIEGMQKGESVPDGIGTGFRDLDSMSVRLRAGDVLVVASRPSMGKTAFALNLAANAALDQRAATQIFALEATKETVINRLLSSEGRVDSSRLMSGLLHDADFVRLGRAAGILSHAPIFIEELPSRKFDELLQRLRATHSEHATDLVIIDYLQLLEGPMPRAENRNQELSAMSRCLKGVAKELRISIVVLAQCSRSPDQRAHHWPILSDVRDAGAIEEDADGVIFLYRDELYEGPEDRDGNSLVGRARVIVAKQRTGPTGFVNLHFNAAFGRFESYQPKKDAVA